MVQERRTEPPALINRGRELLSRCFSGTVFLAIVALGAGLVTLWSAPGLFTFQELGLYAALLLILLLFQVLAVRYGVRETLLFAAAFSTIGLSLGIDMLVACANLAARPLGYPFSGRPRFVSSLLENPWQWSTTCALFGAVIGALVGRKGGRF